MEHFKGVLTAILGAFLIVYPFATAKVTTVLLGWVLIFVAVTELLCGCAEAGDCLTLNLPQLLRRCARDHNSPYLQQQVFPDNGTLEIICH